MLACIYLLRILGLSAFFCACLKKSFSQEMQSFFVVNFQIKGYFRLITFPFVFYNNRKVEGTKLNQNARQKCARNFKVY